MLVATGLPFASGSGMVPDRGREWPPLDPPALALPAPSPSEDPAADPQPEPEDEEAVAALDARAAEDTASEEVSEANGTPRDDPDEAYPEFAAGFRDCLFFLTGAEAELGAGGQIVGEGASYAIFYPVMKQPFDFVLSISQTGSEKACSGQGPRAVPFADIASGIDELAAVFTEFGLVELAFPGEQMAFADCDGAAAMLLTQADGLTVFAGFTGTNAVTYCTSFGRKE